MRNIRQMSKELANKIAAGEVVERPGSIVKELCENSIDAGSTAITVEIREGGISYIRVTDNGSGIAAGEVELAFTRHSTSKMYDEQELFNIASLGFRGEALASIAAVSELMMTTRTQQAESGMQAVVSDGDILQLREAGCPCGTNITVSNLFYNTPARRKFLKKPSQEASYIGDIISRLILAYPGISFKYIQDGKVVLHSPGDYLLSNAVMAVYGRFTADNMLPLSAERGGVRIHGLIGNSELEKSNRTYQSLFVNGRYIRDSLIASAVQAGYVNNICIGKFPMVVLFLEMPCALVDVNVHPNKLEVRFSDEGLISEFVRDAVQNVLSDKREIPALEELPHDYSKWQQFGVVRHGETAAGAGVLGTDQSAKTNHVLGATDANTSNNGVVAGTIEAGTVGAGITEAATTQTNVVVSGAAVSDATNADAPMQVQADPNTDLAGILHAENNEPLEAKETLRSFLRDIKPPVQVSFADTMAEKLQDQAGSVFQDYKLIGQMFNTYVVVESEDAVYLIDQHAAHERLLYERLVKQMESGEPLCQTLLVPQVLSVNYAENAKLLYIMPDLESLGFELEDFGENQYVIRSVPVLMGNPCGEELVREIISRADALKACRAEDIKRNKLLQYACKHAIKGGEPLSDQALNAIMKLIKEEKLPLTCPHGRPILVCLTRKELELRFKRLQS